MSLRQACVGAFFVWCDGWFGRTRAERPPAPALGIKRRVRVESKERTVGQADVREGWTRERRPAQPSGMVAKVAW